MVLGLSYITFMIWKQVLIEVHYQWIWLQGCCLWSFWFEVKPIELLQEARDSAAIILVWYAWNISVTLKGIKGLCWGANLYKKNEELYQEEFYLPSFCRLVNALHWRYDCEWMALLCVYKFLPIKLQRTTITSIAKHQINSCEPINGGVIIHCNVWLAESSHAPASRVPC